MDRRVWGIIIVILSLIIVAGIVYVIFFYRYTPPPAPVTEQPAASETQTTQPAPTQAVEKQAPQPVSPLRKAEVTRDDLTRMASSFAERFGSYSNQSDYGNVRDLEIFMTAKMKIWAENYIVTARAQKGDTSIYYGITTKSISAEASKFDSDAGAAEILVKTQRRESAGTGGNSTTFYQDIIIKFLRESGIWRVDGIYWQSR